MTHYEYWKDELLKIWKSGDQFGIVDDTPQACTDINSCYDCQIGSCNNTSKACKTIRANWLEANCIQYETDWSKVPIDTPVKVIRNNKILPRYYAGLTKRGNPRFYANGCTSYSNSVSPCEIYDEIILALESDQYKYRKEAE